jgi:hypothetical protein
VRSRITCPKLKSGMICRSNLPRHWKAKWFAESSNLILKSRITCRIIWCRWFCSQIRRCAKIKGRKIAWTSPGILPCFL